MSAFAALLVLASCCAHTHARQNATNFTHDVLDRALTFVFGEQNSKWPRSVAQCVQTLGPTKCMNAFSVWRADNALDSFENFGGYQSVFVNDLKKFPWQKYVNVSDDILDDQLVDGAAKLLQLRPLQSSIFPGYKFLLEVKKSGALNVDVYKNDDNEVGRSSSKKLQKRFYAIVPYLLIPGLIMSAVLPFVLPSLKMLTIGAGMLNQMALTGAIFTLLRNNAFNDYYEKKVIYVNAGYKNEKKHAPLHIEEEIHTHTIDDGFFDDGKHSNVKEYAYAGTNDFEQVDERPMNADWINQYYGGESFGNVVGFKNKRSSFHKKQIV